MQPFLFILVIFNTLVALGLMLAYLGRRGDKEEACESDVLRVIIVVPLKGIDLDLRENLISLTSQDFKEFRILGVVDSPDDPALRIATELGIECVTSDFPCRRCSGKVRAISTALPKAKSFDVIVVADSDIRVERQWLRCLVSPLSDRGTGVSTTFPSFYPEGGFWSRVKMFWGTVGQSMMESGITRFVWGGSMAFRSELIDEEFIKEFSESISDDVSVMRIVKSRGLKIGYVPSSRPMVHTDDDFPKFLEWANRQTSLSISSSKRIFIFGVIYFGFSFYLIASAIALSFLNPVFLAFLFPYAFNSVRSELRNPVRTWYFPVITLMLPVVYLYNLTSGLRMREIEWRGRIYRLR
ncbi:MAG: glycosyltransferase [Thermoplasmata archaeon]